MGHTPRQASGSVCRIAQVVKSMPAPGPMVRARVQDLGGVEWWAPLQRIRRAPVPYTTLYWMRDHRVLWPSTIHRTGTGWQLAGIMANPTESPGSRACGICGLRACVNRRVAPIHRGAQGGMITQHPRGRFGKSCGISMGVGENGWQIWGGGRGSLRSVIRCGRFGLSPLG